MVKCGNRPASQKGWDALYRTDLFPHSTDGLSSYIRVSKIKKKKIGIFGRKTHIF
jgi:hypothetical protein